MFQSIKNLLNKNTNQQEPNDQDLMLAAATLMCELIRSDGQIDDIEMHNMKRILKTQFALSNEDVDALIEHAQTSANEAISLQGFTREICNNWGNEQRLKLLEYLWILAMSDDVIDRHERHLVRKLAGLLYLNEHEISVARERAKQHTHS